MALSYVISKTRLEPRTWTTLQLLHMQRYRYCRKLIKKITVRNVFVLSLQYNDMIRTCVVLSSTMEPGTAKR